MPGNGLEVDVEVARAEFTLAARLEVPVGVTVLLGPSGSGKSTLLGAIAGLVRPRAGRVVLGETAWLDVAARVDMPAHRRRVAFVFQSRSLFPHLSVVENVAYGIDPALRGEARAARAREELSRMRVSHLEGRRPATLSGGEAQRVALARALAMRPRAVLLDEPLSAVDRALRAHLVEDLRAAVGALGVPVLYVTHDESEARALGDRAARIEAGRVVREGSIGDVLAVTEERDAPPPP